MEHRFTRSEKLTAPMLVIGRARDCQTVVEPLRPFVAGLCDGQLVGSEARGHFMLVEEPDPFGGDVFAFLQPSRRSRERRLCNASQ